MGKDKNMDRKFFKLGEELDQLDGFAKERIASIEQRVKDLEYVIDGILNILKKKGEKNDK